MAYYFSYSAKALSPVLKSHLNPKLYELLYNKNKLHCTMLYSSNEYQKEYSKLILPDINVTINQIDIWNTNDGFVVVAKVKGDEVFSMHEKIKKIFNIDPDRPFNPHITLQKISSLEDAVDVEKLKFLIGLKVNLTKFNCINQSKKVLKLSP